MTVNHIGETGRLQGPGNSLLTTYQTAFIKFS